MLFGGAYVNHSMPDLFAGKIKANLPIVNGTDAWERYTVSKAPLEVKVYLFNVTNPEQVSRGEAKPLLAQVGPFSLLETRKRKIIAISPDNKTLDFKLFRTHFFLPNQSAPLNSVITWPNIPAFGAFFGASEKAFQEGSDSAINVASDYLANETLYLSRPADDWLFKGYRMDFLDKLNDDGVVLEDQPPDNKFGIFYKKNDTWDQAADGIVTISTGADGDFKNLGRVLKWNGKSEIFFWKGKSCNTLRGTEGQFFHPFVQKDEKLDIFAPDLCRTLSIEFIKTTSIRSIELYRFGISSSFFKPIDYNDETKCYCVKRSHEAKKFCKLSGIVDVSSCRKKPVVLSTPHFFNGDPLLRQAVDGLSPSAANHDTYIDIEPMTGAVLRVKRRLQVNLDMVAYNAWEASKVLKDQRLIHPFIWLEQSVVVPDEIAQRLENKLTKVVRLVRILSYAALITGPIILIATLIFICRDIRTEDKKIRSSTKKSSNSKGKDSGGDYQKVQVIMKPLNSSVTGGDSASISKE